MSHFVTSSLLTLGVALAASAYAAPQTKENAPWNVNMNTNGSHPSHYYGEWPGHHYFASPQDWRDIGIYQFITDRFRDGDPTNNDGKYGGYNLYDVGARHGGDFRGVQESLPYIKNLGYDAIWISPIFQNRHNSYHGYGQIDFTLLDERFGTLADFRSMVDEAHRLGMYVIVDIVVNHMENMLYFEGHEHGGAPFRLHIGEYRLFPRRQGEEYADFKVDNTYFNNGTYSDVYDYGGHRIVDTNGQGSFWNSDFHHNGDLGNYDDPWQNHLGKIYGGLDDLRTTHPRTQDKIIAMTKALISSTDIDGIRMDTPMQVPLYFFKRWVPAVKEHARRLGKDNFFIYGEFYCPRERSATMVGRGRTVDQWDQPFSFIDNTYTMDAGINYDFYFKFIGPALKGQSGGVANAMQQLREDFRAYDFWDPIRQTTSYRMLNFFNNHDQYRMNFENDGFQKSRLGSAIIAFWPGIPLYYYGDEQGFSSRGSGIDGYSREDFMTSKAWYNIPSRAAQNVVSNDNFSMTHPDYLYTQKVMNIRKQYSALRNTHEVYERWMQTNNTSGIYAYTRVWGEQKNWALIAFNTWRDRLEAGGSIGTFYTGWNQGDRIVNAMNPKESYVLGPNGTLSSLKVDGYETKVFVRADNLQSLNPVVSATSIAHDAVIPAGETEMSISFSETMNTASLKSAILVDENPAASVRWDNGRRIVHIKFKATEGIHKVTVKSQASAQDGKRLWADFQTRFRVGSDSNAIVHTQKDPLQDSGLAALNAKGSVMVLHHRATGAQKLRVSLDGGQHYGPWQNFAEETSVPVTPAKQTWDVMVQYWVDGSAAYFARDTVHR